MDVVYADNFDSYLNSNEEVEATGVKEIFRGTEEEVLTWLEEMCKLMDGNTNKAFAINLWVTVGDSEKAIHVSSYIDPEQRAANRDTRRKKFDAILELVREAIEGQDPNAHACDVVERIMKLYS
jgi:hypothetical protein